MTLRVIRHGCCRLALLVVCVAVSTIAGAQADPAYLADMPDVERVRADVQGSDRLDTLARQKAAFEQLSRAVEIGAGSRLVTGLTPAEQRWRDAYRGAADAVRRDAYSGLSNSPPGGLNPFAKSPLQRWNDLTGRYESDAEGRDALLRRYFPDDAYATLAAAIDIDAAERSGGNEFAERYGIATGPVGLLARVLYWLGVAITILAITREVLPKGLSPKDPLKLRTGLFSYRLQWATGRVASYFSRDDRGGVPTTTTFDDLAGTVTHSTGPTQRANVYEMFVLVGDDGRRHVVALVNSGIAIPEGRVATAVWAARKAGAAGDFVLMFDRTAAVTWPVYKELGGKLGVGRAMYLPALLLAAILGAAVTSFAGGASQTLGVLVGVFLGGIGFAALFMFVKTRRVRRFMKQDAPRILSTIEESEAGSAAKPGQAASLS